MRGIRVAEHGAAAARRSRCSRRLLSAGVRRMLRKKGVGIACVLLSFPIGTVSFGLFMEEAANGTTFVVPWWVGLVSAVVLYFVRIELATPEHRDRW